METKKNNSNVNDEQTVYENPQSTATSEETEVQNGTQQSEQQSEQPSSANPSNKVHPTVMSAVTGGMAGLLIGSLSSFMVADTENPAEHTAQEDGPTAEEPNTSEDTPAWSDGSIQVAQGVNDGMTFSEAFAAARAEVGPGGAFEWHGNVYGTYYAAEWNSMTPEEQQAYSDHFSWSGGSSDSQSGHGEPSGSSHEGGEEANGSGAGQTPAGETPGPENPEGPSVQEEVEIVTTTPPENDIEILGVAHDVETGYNVGSILVDGQEILFVDVNSDGTFDYAMSDANGDGTVSDDEIVDVSGEGVTINDFEQASAMEDLLAGTHDGMPDYVNDANVDGLA